MPYRCKDYRKDFSVWKKTLFAKANATYQQVLLAMYLPTTAEKSISSYQLAKEVGRTQKTAWHSERRIHLSMQQGTASIAE